MELMSGYKQTEVGVLPNDWDAKSLGEHATFRTGPFGSALHKSDYVKDGVPVVNPMHIIDGEIVPTSAMTITESAAQSLAEFRLREGEIVIGRRGDMGRCAVVKPHQSGWLCGTGSMIVRPLGFDAHFLRRVLSSHAVISAIVNNSVGTTMVNLNQSSLSNLKVQYPPVAEQTAIAAALADVDTLLAAQDTLIAKKRAIKQGAMQELLTGKRRLPGFGEDWEVKPLAEIAHLSKGEQLHSSEADDGEIYPHYNGGMEPSGFTAKFNTPAFTIAISEGGNSCGYVQRIDRPFWCGGHCYAVVPKAIDPGFLFQALKGRQSEIMGLRVGSGLPNVQKSAIEAFDLRFPPQTAEQIAISEALSEMDGEITALEARRAKTAQLKRGMMQALLTGRIQLV